MAARTGTTSDLDWPVSVLARRREELVAKAPVFWRPAPDAAGQHRAFLEHLITECGARANRTKESVLGAAPRDDGWLIDDAHVPDEDWASGYGLVLWKALANDCEGAPVRFVCPVYELPVSLRGGWPGAGWQG